jgi:hypothetical protein
MVEESEGVVGTAQASGHPPPSLLRQGMVTGINKEFIKYMCYNSKFSLFLYSLCLRKFPMNNKRFLTMILRL